MGKIRVLLNTFLDWIYPPVCLFCGELLPLEKKLKAICTHCSQDMPFISGPVCRNCGRPLELGGICKYCEKRKFPFQRGIAVFPYDRVRFAIKHFKFKACKQDAIPLGKCMTYHLTRNYPSIAKEATMIIPVPVHKKRERNRGFNQAALLANEISKATGIPCTQGNLCRCKNTTPQSQLNDAQRRLNCEGAFSIADPNIFSGQVILLIDDIFTTGATLQACAEEIYKAGAKEVIPFCLSIVNFEEQY